MPARSEASLTDRPDTLAISRRVLLRALAGMAGAGAGLGGFAAVPRAATQPARARPQVGDRLTPLEGERRGQVVRDVDVAIGAPPLLVVPLEPGSGLVRDGSRLNQILLIRVDPETLRADTAAFTAADVIAYSAVCTHAGCPVSEWNPKTVRLICPCHGSEFEVTDGARVAAGPAPRRLAILPLTLEAGELVVAGPFRGRLGFQVQ